MTHTLLGRGGGQRSITFVEAMVSAMIKVRKTKAELLEAVLGGA